MAILIWCAVYVKSENWFRPSRSTETWAVPEFNLFIVVVYYNVFFKSSLSLTGV
jgi:hypothetical protein